MYEQYYFGEKSGSMAVKKTFCQNVGHLRVVQLVKYHIRNLVYENSCMTYRPTFPSTHSIKDNFDCKHH